MRRRRHDTPLFATLSGIFDLVVPSLRFGALGPGDRIDGQTCLVTGANTGLGKAAAIALARRGGKILMACRRDDRRARREIVLASGSGAVELLFLDLARLDSVDDLCDELVRRGLTVDLTVLNAGVAAGRSRRTADGLEEMFQVNYLANVALVQQLLSRGIIENGVFTGRGARPRARPRPRIVFVSSESHRTARPPRLSELGRYRPYGISGAMAQYGESKLLLSTFAAELSRRLRAGGRLDVAVHGLCPGAVNTNIAREAPAWSQPLLAAVFRVLFQSPAAAAEPITFLCCSRAIEGQTNIYLHRMTRKLVSSAAADPDRGRRLWEISARLATEAPRR